MPVNAVPNPHFDTDMAPLLRAAIEHARAQRCEPPEEEGERRQAVLVARQKRHLRLIRGEAQ